MEKNVESPAAYFFQLKTDTFCSKVCKFAANFEQRVRLIFCTFDDQDPIPKQRVGNIQQHLKGNFTDQLKLIENGCFSRADTILAASTTKVGSAVAFTHLWPRRNLPSSWILEYSYYIIAASSAKAVAKPNFQMLHHDKYSSCLLQLNKGFLFAVRSV